MPSASFRRTAPTWSMRSSARSAPSDDRARPSRIESLRCAAQHSPRPAQRRPDRTARRVRNRPRRGRAPDAAVATARTTGSTRPTCSTCSTSSPRPGRTPRSSSRRCRRCSPGSTRSPRRSRPIPDEVHLTVGVVRYAKGDRVRKGVASTFLAERLRPGQKVRVFVHPSHGFQLPDSGDTPMIMVGPGTGIAPFRAFLEERQASGAHRARTGSSSATSAAPTDFLYEDELRRFQQSRAPDPARHRLLARPGREDLRPEPHARERARSSGTGSRKAPTSTSAATPSGWPTTSIVPSSRSSSKPAARSAEAAKAYVANMTKTGRYQRDVY